MNTFTFRTFTRPLAIPSDVSTALLKHSFCIRKPFYAEEGHSILTETSFLRKFLVSDNKFFNSSYFSCLFVNGSSRSKQHTSLTTELKRKLKENTEITQNLF